MAGGVQAQVYVSSVSAHRGAVTEYGLAKAEAEAYFVGKGLTAARPGLVIGPGGMFARMQALVRERRIVPVVYPSGLIAVVSVDDLTASLTAIVEQRLRGLFRLYADERVTMHSLLAAMRGSLQSRAVLVPVPYHAALASARMLELFGIPGPLASDSLRAMRANQMVTEPGDLARFVQAPMRLVEMVDAAR
jgi:uncharacterized protein YbjT (DUF2867 family)